jgi:hypothetical protein
MFVGAAGAIVALLGIALASGPISAAMVGFLDIVPVSLGSNFIVELAAFVFGFALLVGAGGATISVRAHLAR